MTSGNARQWRFHGTKRSIKRDSFSATCLEKSLCRTEADCRGNEHSIEQRSQIFCLCKKNVEGENLAFFTFYIWVRKWGSYLYCHLSLSSKPHSTPSQFFWCLGTLQKNNPTKTSTNYGGQNFYSFFVHRTFKCFFFLNKNVPFYAKINFTSKKTRQ